MSDEDVFHMQLKETVQLVCPESSSLIVSQGRLGMYAIPDEGHEFTEESIREGVSVVGVGETIRFGPGARAIITAMQPETICKSVGAAKWHKSDIPTDFPIVTSLQKCAEEKGYYFGYEDRYAKVYEHGADSWESLQENASLREIYTRHPRIFDGDIVDLGTGEGRDSLFLLRNRIGRSVTSYDVSHTALEKARKRARQESLPAFGFIEKDMIYLRDVEANSFDLALNMGALHMLDRADDRVMHIGRVFDILRPGGYFVVDHCASDWGRGFHTISDYDAIADELVPGRVITRHVEIGGERKPVDLEVLHYSERPPSELLAELTAAGFEEFASLETDTEAFGNSTLQVVRKPIGKSHGGSSSSESNSVRENILAVSARAASTSIARDHSRQLPQDEIRDLIEAGFSRLRIPVEFGGQGLGIPEWGDVLIELAAADPNLVQILRAHIAFVEDVVHRPSGAYRDRWMARLMDGDLVGNAWAEAGPIVMGQKRTAFVDRDGELFVSGKKQYTTGSIFADWADVSGEYEGRSIAASVSLRQDGVTLVDTWDGFGQRTTGTGSLTLEDVRVDPLDISPFNDRIRYQTALYQWVLLSVQAGIVTAVERDVTNAVKNRSRNYSHSSASVAKDDPNIQAIVGEISSIAFAVRALVRGVSEAIQIASETGCISRDSEDDLRANEIAEIRSEQAQVIISDLVPRAATLLFDALGASATSITADLDRHWRNSRTVASHNPTVFKRRAVGDWLLNGTPPPVDWQVGTPAK